MHRVFRMQNTVQPYGWGSHIALAELLGLPGPTAEPQAELWMGAHPKAPSKVWVQNQWQDLEGMIAQDPIFFLGESTAARFENMFPFLFKVLAVEKPLSIQAHPNDRQARNGFERENKQGISLDSSIRNYKDNRHKPECVCALTPFWVLYGFRDPADIVSILEPIWPSYPRAGLDLLKKNPQGNGLRDFFQDLLTQSEKARHQLVSHVTRKATAGDDANPIYQWILRLNAIYPGDVGCIAPGFLNLICLQPGQALFLPSGLLHAYLEGVAIEIMANSDNVLRGGLTPKHLDVKELIRILNFQCPQVKILSPLPITKTEAGYPCRAEEFALSVIHIGSNQTHSVCDRNPGPEILLCTKGRVALNCPDESKTLSISKGESVLITGGVVAYDLMGEGVVYKASTAIGRDGTP